MCPPTSRVTDRKACGGLFDSSARDRPWDILNGMETASRCGHLATAKVLEVLNLLAFETGC